MNVRLFMYGLVGWIAATAAIRFGGQRLLRPGAWTGMVLLFLVSFALTGWLGRRVCVAQKLGPEQRFSGIASLLLPTLLLDPFSSAFFPFVFPNIDSSMSGAFGGWMLISCAGALVGAGFQKTTRQS